MDCVTGTGTAQNIELLTQADKIDKLGLVFAKSHRKTDVFLPSDDFYNQINGPDDVENMASQIFNWLGIKHRSLSFHIDPTQTELVKYSGGSSPSVTLGWHCQEDALLTGGVVAHAISHHLLIMRAKIKLASTAENEELTDLATIYAGLGVLVLNSLESKYHSLAIMAPANYYAECIDYFNAHNVVPSIWTPYVVSDILEKLGNISAIKQRSFVIKRILALRKHKLRLLLAGFVTLLIVSTLIGYIQSRPQYLSAEMAERLDKVNILRAQVERCEDEVKRKQATWDTSDIFIQRQINADQVRCASLRNRHNYEVNQYNAEL